MGYDMQSKVVPEPDGYFRLNIWGMGWMRDIMFQAGITEDRTLRKFCSNDGCLVGERLGKRIAKALKAFAKKGRTYTHESMVLNKDDIPAGEVVGRRQVSFGAGFPPMTIVTVKREMSEEDVRIVLDFARFNEECAPYEVF